MAILRWFEPDFPFSLPPGWLSSHMPDLPSIWWKGQNLYSQPCPILWTVDWFLHINAYLTFLHWCLITISNPFCPNWTLHFPSQWPQNWLFTQLPHFIDWHHHISSSLGPNLGIFLDLTNSLLLPTSTLSVRPLTSTLKTFFRPFCFAPNKPKHPSPCSKLTHLHRCNIFLTGFHLPLAPIIHSLHSCQVDAFPSKNKPLLWTAYFLPQMASTALRVKFKLLIPCLQAPFWSGSWSSSPTILSMTHCGPAKLFFSVFLKYPKLSSVLGSLH